MLLRTLFLFIPLLYAWPLFAQDMEGTDSTAKRPPVNHYLSGAATLTWVHYKDETNSPLTYHSDGFPLGVEISYDNRSLNHSGYSKILFTAQSLTTDLAPLNGNSPEEFLTVRFNTSRVWNTATLWNGRISYRLGYMASFDYNHQINYRLGNAAYTYAIFLNGGVGNRFEFPFTIKTEKKFWFVKFNQPEQHLRLSWQFDVPLVGMITRPNYAGIRHFANGEFSSNLSREMTDHLEFTSPHNFFMLRSQFELWVPLGNSNKLKLAYQWEGFSYYGNYTSVQSSMWSIMVGLMFKIDSRGDADQITKPAER